MRQRCPNCGKWCKADKRDFLDKAAHGFTKKNSFVDFIPGSPFLKAAGEALMGDSYHFTCSECGNEWSTNNLEDDQTEEYNEWVKEQKRNEEIIELRDKFPTILHSSEQEKQDYAKELQRQLANTNNTKEQTAALYDTIAAAYHLLGEKNEALKAVNKSLELFDDDINTHILKGIIMGQGRNAHDTYAAMQEVIHYKSEKRTNSPYFTTAQIEEEFSVLQTAYAQNFLSIPVQQRKHLFLCEKLTHLPQSFKVLPLSEMPTEMKFPMGHPVADTLYVCHPYRTDYYVPNDSYILETFRDEINEFCWIMECLGAKHIEYSDSVNHETQTSQGQNRNINAEGDYAGAYSGKGSYETEKQKDDYKRFLDELEERKDFALAGEPALPRDLVWYPHRIDWQRECESRLAGRLHHKEFVIKSASSVFTTESERKKIEAEMQILLFSASGGTEGNESFSLKREQSHSLRVCVDFHPLSDYHRNDVHTMPAIESPTLSMIEKPFNKIQIIWIIGAIIAILIAIIIGIMLF